MNVVYAAYAARSSTESTSTARLGSGIAGVSSYVSGGGKGGRGESNNDAGTIVILGADRRVGSAVTEIGGRGGGGDMCS